MTRNAHAGRGWDEMERPNSGKPMGHSLSEIGYRARVIDDLAAAWIALEDHPEGYLVRREMESTDCLADLVRLLEECVAVGR